MDSQLDFSIEAHPTGATLYLSGALSVAGALRALGACQSLPPRHKRLGVDMCAVELFDPAALEAMSLVLREWRARRRGTTCVKLPRERTFVSLGKGPVGLRSPRQRAADPVEAASESGVPRPGAKAPGSEL